MNRPMRLKGYFVKQFIYCGWYDFFNELTGTSVTQWPSQYFLPSLFKRILSSWAAASSPLQTPGSILSSASASTGMEAGLTHWNKQQNILIWSPFTLDLTICLASQSQPSFFIVLTLLISRPITLGFDMLLPWHETTTQMVASLSVLPFSLLPFFLLTHSLFHHPLISSYLFINQPISHVFYLSSICHQFYHLFKLSFINYLLGNSDYLFNFSDCLLNFFTAFGFVKLSVSWSETHTPPDHLPDTHTNTIQTTTTKSFLFHDNTHILASMTPHYPGFL